MWCCIDRWVVSDGSEDHSAFILSVKQSRNSDSLTLYSKVLQSLKTMGTTHSGDTVSHSRGPEASEIPMWEPQFLHRSEHVRIVMSCVSFLAWLSKPCYWLSHLPALPPWTAPQTRELVHTLSEVKVTPYERSATSPSGQFGTPARSRRNSPHIPQQAQGQIWTHGFSPNTEMTRP